MMKQNIDKVLKKKVKRNFYDNPEGFISMKDRRKKLKKDFNCK